MEPIILRGLICAALAAYGAASAGYVLKLRKAAPVLFACGFGLSAAGLGYRWMQVGHVPLQNLFEVFLCMGAGTYPFALLCEHVLHVPGRAVDAFIGTALLALPAFVFRADPQPLPPALQGWPFIPHVASYLAAYIVLIKAASLACAQVGSRAASRSSGRERATYRLVRLGFPLLTLGLILGAWWGKLAWGDYWNWDPKELWSLATWLVFLVYLHFRRVFGSRFPALNAAVAVCGGATILLGVFWVNLAPKIFPGLHLYAM